MAALVLFVVEGAGAGTTFAIDETVVIGRGREADILLADLEISRQHLRARGEGETLVIEDLGSSNGTTVNGERIEGATRLREGDLIKIGGTTLEFRCETHQLDDATPTEATSIHRPG